MIATLITYAPHFDDDDEHRMGLGYAILRGIHPQIVRSYLHNHMLNNKKLPIQFDGWTIFDEGDVKMLFDVQEVDADDISYFDDVLTQHEMLGAFGRFPREWLGEIEYFSLRVTFNAQLVRKKATIEKQQRRQ
jgi:hypothetical protein